jgi:hypothetical protein
LWKDFLSEGFPMVIDLTLVERNAAMPAVSVKDTDGFAAGARGFLDEALTAFRAEDCTDGNTMDRADFIGRGHDYPT